MDAKPIPQHFAYAPPAPAPIGGPKGPAGSQPVFATPIWVTAVRGFQLFLAFIIMILAGLLIHGLALDAIVFALVCGLFTFVISIYALVAEKVPACRPAYNYWAILSLDLLLAIFWLASMGANAALRGTFTVSVSADCWDDGSAVNAGHCIVSRRSHLGKRAAVAGKAALAEMSAIAGLSALVMLLFIASLAHLGHQVRLHLEAQKKGADNGSVEMKLQAQPMLDPNSPAGVAVPQSVHPTYTDTMQYPVQGYAPQTTAYDTQAYGQHQHPELPHSQPQQYQELPQPQPQPQQYQYSSQQQQQQHQHHHHQLPQHQAAHPQAQAEMAVSPATFHSHPYQQQPQQHTYSPSHTPVQQPPHHPPQ